jgi:hypothetical protein
MPRRPQVYPVDFSDGIRPGVATSADFSRDSKGQRSRPWVLLPPVSMETGNQELKSHAGQPERAWYFIDRSRSRNTSEMRIQRHQTQVN